MLAEIQCLCSGGKHMIFKKDLDPWSIPYGYEMEDWVVLWCTTLVLQPKEERLYFMLLLLLLLLFILITKLH